MKTTKGKIILISFLFILFWIDILGVCMLVIHKEKRLNNPEPEVLFADTEQPEQILELLPIPEEPADSEPEADTVSLTEENIPQDIKSEKEPEMEYAYYPGAVDLRWYLPEAQFELLFTTDRNVTGRGLYPAVPLLEENTARMLKQAYDRFLEDGYILKIYDAYRPRSAQQALWNVVRNNKYIADPSKGGSWHQSGRAVDISLVEKETGIELSMPTPMHTFTDEAGRYATNSWSEEVTKNVDYMTAVMKKAGFSTIRTEWWHFEYNAKNAPVLNHEIDYSTLEYMTAEAMSQRLTNMR